MAITKLKRSKSKPQNTRSTLLKTHHLSIILGALLLSPGLTACSTNTSAQPLEHTTATQSSEQKAMTPEEEKIIGEVKNIFRAMAEPGITPKALLSRFGKPDPKWHNAAFPFNKSFSQVQVIESFENPNIVHSLHLDLTPNTPFPLDSLKKVFGNYKETVRQHWDSPRGFLSEGKLPEVPGYVCRFIVDYQFKRQSDKSPPLIMFSFSIYPEEDLMP
jgi:hypothetical protein